MPSVEFWLSPFYFVFDPTKRIFFVYLFTSFVFALIVLGFQEKSGWKAFRSFFDKRLWKHPSTRLDLSLLFFNTFLKSFVFLFVVVSSVSVAKAVVQGLYFLNPDHTPGAYNYSVVILLFTVSHFVLLDFCRFLQHYCFHKIPFLWKFHRIHHSALVMTPLTLYRTHPVESLVSAFRRIFVTGVLSGLFLFYTRSVIDVYSIFGVNALDFAFNFFGSNLRHSHVWLSFGPLNHVFMSPAQHQIHHSRSDKHQNKNMGFAFSVWDKLFGSFYQVKGKEFLVFGVRGQVHKNLWQALKAPFIAY